VVTGGNNLVEATAQIFRGLTVMPNGTVVSSNTRVARSSKRNGGSAKKCVKANGVAKSRQAAKIDQLKALVEQKPMEKSDDAGSPSKKNKAKKGDKSKSKGDEKSQELSEEPPTNGKMLSLVPIGEYYDMKHLVRDGAKKLQAAEKGLVTEEPVSPKSTSSMNAGIHASSPKSPASPRAAIQAARQNSPRNYRSPPRLQRHPRDHPPSTSRQSRVAAASSSGCMYNPYSDGAFASNNSDWSEALGFSQGLKSFWNCGSSGAAGETKQQSYHSAQMQESDQDPTVNVNQPEKRHPFTTNNRKTQNKRFSNNSPVQAYDRRQDISRQEDVVMSEHDDQRQECVDGRSEMMM